MVTGHLRPKTLRT